MSAPPTASASFCQVKVPSSFPFLRDDALTQNQWLKLIICFTSAEKCPAASSTEDVLQVSPSSRERACTEPGSPSREYGRNPAMAQSEFRPARRVMSEEVIQDILDALPSIPIYVRELKRQISTLQESNEIMESRILQLEKT